jgi:hypothetical protein
MSKANLNLNLFKFKFILRLFKELCLDRHQQSEKVVCEEIFLSRLPYRRRCIDVCFGVGKETYGEMPSLTHVYAPTRLCITLSKDPI